MTFEPCSWHFVYNSVSGLVIPGDVIFSIVGNANSCHKTAFELSFAKWWPLSPDLSVVREEGREMNKIIWYTTVTMLRYTFCCTKNNLIRFLHHFVHIYILICFEKLSRTRHISCLHCCRVTWHETETRDLINKPQQSQMFLFLDTELLYGTASKASAKWYTGKPLFYVKAEMCSMQNVDHRLCLKYRMRYVNHPVNWEVPFMSWSIGYQNDLLNAIFVSTNVIYKREFTF